MREKLAICQKCVHVTLKDHKVFCNSSNATINFVHGKCPLGLWAPKNLNVDLDGTIRLTFPDPVEEARLDALYERVDALKWSGERMRRNADGTIFLTMPDPSAEARLDEVYDRIGPLKWSGERRATGVVRKIQDVAEFAKSMASGEATEEIIEKRKASCFGDQKTQAPPCVALKVEGGRKFCGACGCGKWMLAELDGSTMPKLRHAFLNCPLKRPGFSNSQQ